MLLSHCPTFPIPPSLCYSLSSLNKVFMSSHQALGSLRSLLLQTPPSTLPLEHVSVPEVLLWVTNPHGHSGSSSGHRDLTSFHPKSNLFPTHKARCFRVKCDSPQVAQASRRAIGQEELCAKGLLPKPQLSFKHQPTASAYLARQYVG